MNRRPARRLRRAACVVWLFGVVLAIAGPTSAADTFVYRMPTTGVVDNVMAGYISEGIARAQRDGASAVVIELNTPGGSLEATQRIVSAILEAPVPVIVWVAPSGGRAASAGTFITLAANLAYMAPGTNIGAASPVGSGGEDIGGTLGDKVKNDAIANITAIAQHRGRNVEWAVSTVDRAVSSSAEQAVAIGAVDGIAATIEEVLRQSSGQTVDVAGVPVTLELAGAEVRPLDMNPFQSLLHLLSDPNIAFVLFSLGFYGLIYEVINPNFVTGIIGGLAIILAFIGFGSLPLNVGGLILIGFGIVLIVLEQTVTSHGLLTVGGIICFVLGAAALYTEPGPIAPDVRVAWPLTALMAGSAALFAFVIVRAVIAVRRVPPLPVGLGGSVGAPATGLIGQVRRDLSPVGSVYLGGEEWSARSAAGTSIPRGEAVRVVGQDGLTLIVAPLDTA